MAPLPHSDRELLRQCTRDELRWRELPKLASGRRSEVARVELGGGPAVIKRYSSPGAHRLRTFLRRSRAEREARALASVTVALPGNPVCVLAWAEERHWGFVPRAYLVATELEGSFDLRAIQGLDAPARQAAIRAVLGRLPRTIARLHAGGVFAATLRGKNVLFQPSTNRFALIDLPYARRVRRLSLRQRTLDLAMLSLQLTRFLDADQWALFLINYRLCERTLSESHAARIRPDRIARVAMRLAHRTPVSAARNSLKRRFRRSAVGPLVTGHRYPEER